MDIIAQVNCSCKRWRAAKTTYVSPAPAVSYIEKRDTHKDTYKDTSQDTRLDTGD